jgi:glyoxylase-like metal-dependent hydrolase (beta-lactamase superfamily II)
VIRLRCSTWRSRALGYEVSAFLVRGTLVDTAFPHVGRAVARWLGERRPAGAIVTHGHEDHAGNVEHLAALGIPLWLAEATRRRVSAPPPLRLYRRVTWGSPLPLRSPVSSFVPDRLQPIATPGHSVDHHVVWDPVTGTVFSGDLFLGVKVRVAHSGEDPRLQVASLRAMLKLGPARLFDAHRGPVPDPGTALGSKIAWMEETIGAIDNLIARGWGDRAIRAQVLGSEPLVGLASRGEYSHLGLVRAVRRTLTV